MLEYMDFLSKKPDIYINGNERFSTWSGKFLSILLSLCIVGITGYFFNELVSRKSFQVFENTVSENYPVLNYTGFPIASYLIYATGKLVPLNNYEIQTGMYEVTGYKDGEIQTRISYGNKSILCDKTDINAYFQYSNGMLCSAQDLNKTIYGIKGDLKSGYSSMFVNIHKCKNGTYYDEYGIFHNNTNCAPQAEIDANLNIAHLMIEFLDNKINHLYFQPFETKKTSLSFPLSWSLYRDIFLQFQLVVYESDIGFLFEDISTNSQFRFLGSETIINTRSLASGLFTSVRFIMSSNKAIYFRKYLKLQVTLANIGGFSKLIILLAQSFVNFFSEKSYFLYLIDKFYAKEKKFIDSKMEIMNPNKKISIYKIEKSIDKGIGVNKELISTSINNFTNNNQQEIQLNNINDKTLIQDNFNILYYSRLSMLVNKNDKIVRIKEMFTIWDLICVPCKKKNLNVQKLKFAKSKIKHFLSLNNLLKINLKLENLIEIVFTEDEKKEFQKIKLRQVYDKI